MTIMTQGGCISTSELQEVFLDCILAITLQWTTVDRMLFALLAFIPYFIYYIHVYILYILYQITELIGEKGIFHIYA